MLQKSTTTTSKRLVTANNKIQKNAVRCQFIRQTNLSNLVLGGIFATRTQISLALKRISKRNQFDGIREHGTRCNAAALCEFNTKTKPS